VVEKDELAALIGRIEDEEGRVEPAVYHRIQTIVRKPIPPHPPHHNDVKTKHSIASSPSHPRRASLSLLNLPPRLSPRVQGASPRSLYLYHTPTHPHHPPDIQNFSSSLLTHRLLLLLLLLQPHLRSINQIERYQEFGQLLDPHLEGWIMPLAAVLRAQAHAGEAADMPLVQRAARLLHAFATVRGYKTVVRFFPHEAGLYKLSSHLTR
jgi:hypothetical protein